MMQVGICKIRLHLAETHSLKEKRRVIKPIITRVRNSYEVAIAEVEDQELWQMATLGIVCATNSHPQADEILSKVIDFIRWGRFDVDIVDTQREILSF